MLLVTTEKRKKVKMLAIHIVNKQLYLKIVKNVYKTKEVYVLLYIIT